ncbi:RluA family pseudouridine synthase [Patescibacteria group bacterium]|nr:RluA family pseudouridine synthase [Patescibacteria group bacterium]MCL5010357.1 RluA family pseudouridine synthase [Patescibacteria group bacterium]
MNSIKIIYEDGDILVLDKPSGITVNRSDTTKEEKTVQDWVEQKFSIFNFRAVGKASGDARQFSKDEETDFYKRAGIVHRLDKETSGILLAAKTPEAFINLARQFKERMVKKTYLALAHGKVEPATGEISVPIGRLPWNRKRFGVLAGGREAQTRYRVISNFKFQVSNSQKDLTFLELYPQTGRTHQIRVHLKYLLHPIFADSLYAGRKTVREDREFLPRLFLHAGRISFFHPKTQAMVSFESPLPSSLQSFLNLLSR